MANGNAKDKPLNINQAGEHLNCSKRTIYRLISECEIQGFKVRGSLRVKQSNLDMYIARQIATYQLDNGVAG